MDLRIIATTLLWICLELSRTGPPPSTEGFCAPLPPARQAHGLVVDLDGQPLAGARVLLLPNDFAVSPSDAETDAAGRFRFSEPAAGRHSLSAVAPGFRELTVPGIEIPDAAGPWPLGTLVLEPDTPLRGRVSDAQDHGIAGAWVTVEEPLGAFSREPLQTDADGGFVLNGMPAADAIRLRVAHPDYQATTLEVPADATEEIHVVLSQGVELAGEVVDDKGRPVSGAVIEAEREDGPSARVASGDDGRFRMSGLVPGRARLRARADAVGMADPVEVLLAAGATAPVRLVLRARSRIVGSVRAESGLAVDGAELTFEPYRPGPRPAPATSRSVPSDAEGRFTAAGLAAGRYRVTVRHPDYAPAAEEVRLAADETARIEVVLAERDREALMVRGQVTTTRAATVAGARVVLQAAGEAVAESASGADGLFTLEAPTAGSYLLEVTHPELAMHREPLSLDGKNPPAEILVELDEGGTISGELTGVAVEELSRVSLVARSAAGGGPMVRGKVSYDGYVVEHLAPGDWLVSAALGNRTVSAEVSLSDGGDARADLRFAAGHRLHGRVLRDGVPVAGATVQVFCRGTGFHAVAIAEADGAFVLDEIPAETCDLLAMSGRIRIEETVEVDGDREVVLATRTFHVAGQVLSADVWKAIAGATIELVAAGATAGGRLAVRSDARGRFTLAGIEQGVWKVRVTHEGFGAVERLLQVGEEAAAAVGDWQFLLPPTEAVDVYVLGADGVAPQQVSFEVLDAYGDIVLGATVYQPALDGRVTLRALPPGTWWLRVADRGQVRQAEIHVPGPSQLIELGGPLEEP